MLWHGATGAPRLAPRRYLTLIDGVLAGDGAGPEDPIPRPLGWVLASTNPVAADAVAASLMGFDWQSIPAIARGFAGSPYGLTGCPAGQVRLVTAAGTAHLDALPTDWVTSCRAHFGWAGHLTAAASSHANL